MSNLDNNIDNVSISSEIIETVIGPQTKFVGTVNTDKPIRIDGYFEGEITTTDIIVVSEGGEFNGNVNCRELQLVGHGQGKAVCSELMQIVEGGVFDGDVETKDLITVRGSVLNGNCKIVR